jgi:hypothetical protein
MSISSIGGSPSVSSVANVAPNVSRTPSSIPPAGGTQAAHTSLSKPGQLLGRLQQLAQQDPAKFKEVTQQLADQLHQLAKNETGPAADRANQLADRFAKASQSGDMSALSPEHHDAGAAHGHHHHHGHGGGGGIAEVLSSALEQVNQALGDGAAPAGDTSTAG